MASETLRQRTRDDPNAPASVNNDTTVRLKRQNRMAMAKRGLRSLAVAISLPLSLTLFTKYFFGTGATYDSLRKPFWFTHLWALHLMCLISSFLMGLSGWLIWAEAGFHKHPTALSLYSAQLCLGLVWDPIVLRNGSSSLGLLVCLAMAGALVGCFKIFKGINPIASNLVIPCLVWAAFLSIVNLTLVFL